MSLNFMPTPFHPEQVELVIKAYECVIPQNCVYMSVPITTGKVFVDWKNDNPDVSEEDYKNEHFKNVISVNKVVAYTLKQKLVDKFGEIVINPAASSNYGWVESDYLYLWQRIIEKHVKLIVFSPEWEYSNGCVFEYYLGKKLGIPMTDASIQPMQDLLAKHMICDAIEYTKQRQCSTDFIERVYQGILNL